MTENANHKGPESDRIRKLLKNLPPVGASSDFEERLQRRINRGKAQTKKSGFLGSIFRPRRIPVFAYSLVAVAVVGALSYYMFILPNIGPTETAPVIEFKQQEIPTQNNGHSKEIAPSGDKDDRSQPTKPQAPPSKALESSPVKGKQRSGDVSRQNNEVDEKRSKERGVQQMTNPPQINPQETGVRDAENSVEQMVKDKVEEASKAKPSIPQAPQKIMPLMKSVQSPIMLSAETMTGDSAFIADSLKLDSLQRLQKILQLQQTKKAKKPNP